MAVLSISFPASLFATSFQLQGSVASIKRESFEVLHNACLRTLGYRSLLPGQSTLLLHLIGHNLVLSATRRSKGSRSAMVLFRDQSETSGARRPPRPSLRATGCEQSRDLAAAHFYLRARFVCDMKPHLTEFVEHLSFPPPPLPHFCVPKLKSTPPEYLHGRNGTHPGRTQERHGPVAELVWKPAAAVGLPAAGPVSAPGSRLRVEQPARRSLLVPILRLWGSVSAGPLR